MKKKFLIFVCALCVAAVFAADKEQIFGIYKIIMREPSGTFSLYAYDADAGKSVPLLSAIDNSSYTKFFLKYGKTVYALDQNSGVEITQKLTDSGVSVQYTVKDKAAVTFSMTFLSSAPDKEADIIQCVLSLRNISASGVSCALKGVFDTCLGELTSRHFSTASHVSLNNEHQFFSMAKDKWVRTSNGSVSMQFILDGENISDIETVTVANRDILLSDTWMPPVVVGRRFNSLYSYNNSALSIHWKPQKLSPQQTVSFCFYLSAAVNEGIPADTASPYFTGALVSSASPKEAAPAETDEFDDNDFSADYAVITKEQLDEKYIAALLERIRHLENDFESIDKNEIRRLNAELDAILEKVRLN
ncbi:MAG: hypothetical protein NC041_05025 [Bacteroides sp.]|nr:hypothetical protein [Prevotella sp.]MCM1407320.1 hypothetical protein [Treponema brennaborense]MCM1469810.1 hypothetical protein [Bacteroides sp.]